MDSTKSLTIGKMKGSLQYWEQMEKFRKCFVCYQSINIHNYIFWGLQEFCNKDCLIVFQKSFKLPCAYCGNKIHDTNCGKYCKVHADLIISFCSIKCLQKAATNMCTYCEKQISNTNETYEVSINVYVNQELTHMNFCSEKCYNNYLMLNELNKPVIPPGSQCVICSNHNITILRRNQSLIQYFCSKSCEEIAYNFVELQKAVMKCEMCQTYFSTILNSNIGFEDRLIWCSKPCKNIYIIQNTETLTCDCCNNKKSKFYMFQIHLNELVNNFCSIYCMNTYLNCENVCSKSLKYPNITLANAISETNVSENSGNQEKTIILLTTPKEYNMRNVASMCSIKKCEKSTFTKVCCFDKATQTNMLSNLLFPTPIPIYIPTPLWMYSMPIPITLPIPVPIPVPIFLPCSYPSLNKVMDNIKFVPNLPKESVEADIIKIAEIISEDYNKELNIKIGTENLSASSNVLENVEMYEGVDIENALSISTCEIPRSLGTYVPPMKIRKSSVQDFNESRIIQGSSKGTSITETNGRLQMRLDHTLGINAWNQWASKISHMQNELKFIQLDMLQMTSEELCFALCLFVKELRKPNGDEYAPDTIYYLCLGIQHYLHINNRSDSIFFDEIYAPFISCLDEFSKKFCSLYDDESHFIVTRLEEEHLWETKQLGCWSPIALLNTLIYFNTKYYCRSSVEDHMELSFFHIMKAYKKSKIDNYYILRLFSKCKANNKNFYEQHPNQENQQRCPVRLYEFYLSKCPEDVKNSPSMLYLMPEKCVIHSSPLWYSSKPLPKEYLAALLNRVKMVKEINIALLSS